VAMRYKGQGWEIPVHLGAGAFDELAAELLAAQFTKAYEEFFGRAIEDLTIEAVSWAVRVSSVQERPDPVDLVAVPESSAPSSATRSMYDPATDARRDAVVIHRSALTAGEGVPGPAVIIEDQTTTVLGAHHLCTMQTDGSLLITRTAGEDGTG